PAAVEVVNGKRIFFPSNLIAERDLVDRERFHALDWRNESVAWALRQELGLPEFLNPERDLRNDDPALMELARKAQRNSLVIKEFLGITVRRDASAIKILSQLLEQLGQKLVCDRKEGSRNQQVRIYRLAQEPWQVAQAVLEYRKAKRESFTQSVIETEPTPVVTKTHLLINTNKGEVVTTEEPAPDFLSEEMTDGLDILQQAIAVQDREALQAVWSCWQVEQQRQLLMLLGREARQQLVELLRPPALIVGAVVRWLGKAGEWIVQSVDEAWATICRVGEPQAIEIAEFVGLQVIESEAGG
ncbi:MAG: hypothetical protein F6K19_49020, partial [Cyanothece sp. SIO1E1]|nr:hypothetical protein [Cyanothece sp. SIO1E1]